MRWISFHKPFFYSALFLSAFWPVSPSFAGVLVEPLMNFKIAGSTKHQGDKFETRQFDYGARVGYMESGGFLALEGLISTWNIEAPDGSANEDYAGFSAGITLGYQLAWLRLFGGYYFLSSQTSEFDQSKIKGSGIHFGVGLGNINLPTIYLTYKAMNYKERETTDGETTTLDGDLAIKPALVMIGLSIPFEL